MSADWSCRCLCSILFVDILHHEQIRNTGKDSCRHPGCRVTETGERIADDFHGNHSYNKARKQFRNAAHHRQKTVAATLHCISENKNSAERYIKKRTHIRVCFRPRHHGGHIDITREEERKTWLQKKEDENSGSDRIGDGSQKCSANSLFDPRNIAFPEILPAVGCHRLSHCGKALRDQILQLTGRRKSGNRL